jgi:hypothetical protein
VRKGRGCAMPRDITLWAGPALPITRSVSVDTLLEVGILWLAWTEPSDVREITCEIFGHGSLKCPVNGSTKQAKTKSARIAIGDPIRTTVSKRFSRCEVSPSALVGDFFTCTSSLSPHGRATVDEPSCGQVSMPMTHFTRYNQGTGCVGSPCSTRRRSPVHGRLARERWHLSEDERASLLKLGWTQRRPTVAEIYLPATTALPSSVFGPVAFVHGRHRLIDAACLARRSGNGAPMF